MSCISVIFSALHSKKHIVLPFLYPEHPPEKRHPEILCRMEEFSFGFMLFFFFFISPSDHNTKEKLHIKFNLFFRYGKERERVGERAEASRSSLILLA
jgi:hypothetical protein